MKTLSFKLYRLLSSLRHWLERRFTAAGLLALVGMLAVGAIGVDLSQSAGAQTFALLFCLLLQGFLAGLLFKGRFKIERQLPRYASVGREFHYRVLIDNQATKGFHSLELWEDFEDPRPSFKDFANHLDSETRTQPLYSRSTNSVRMSFRQTMGGRSGLFSVAAKSQCEQRIAVTALRRGPLRFKGSLLTRPDPLGLVRGWIKTTVPESVLVLPKRYPLPELSLPGLNRHQPGGVELASSIGMSDQFVSLRDYRPGDPPRHIHWRSWAHANRPIVKEFQDEFFVRHALVLDTFVPAGLSTAVFEEAVSVAASFACTITTQESLLDLLFVGSQAFCLTTGRGVGHTEQALEALASVQPSPASSFNVLQDLVLLHAQSACACICVMLHWDESRKQLVRRLRATGLPVWALVVAHPTDAKQFAAEVSTPAEEFRHVLEIGQIERDLQLLKGFMA